MQTVTEIPEPTIHDLHSAMFEPLLVIIEHELDALDSKEDSVKRLSNVNWLESDSLRHYFSGQRAALMKLRRNLASTQASAIERETGA